jgi:hypothetical protein
LYSRQLIKRAFVMLSVILINANTLSSKLVLGYITIRLILIAV